jgi:hypothetical protein
MAENQQQQQQQQRRRKSSTRRSSSRRVPKDVSFFSEPGGFGHKYFTRKHSSQISSKDVRYDCESADKRADRRRHLYVVLTLFF